MAELFEEIAAVLESRSATRAMANATSIINEPWVGNATVLSIPVLLTGLVVALDDPAISPTLTRSIQTVETGHLLDVGTAIDLRVYEPTGTEVADLILGHRFTHLADNIAVEASITPEHAEILIPISTWALLASIADRYGNQLDRQTVASILQDEHEDLIANGWAPWIEANLPDDHTTSRQHPPPLERDTGQLDDESAGGVITAVRPAAEVSSVTRDGVVSSASTQTTTSLVRSSRVTSAVNRAWTNFITPDDSSPESTSQTKSTVRIGIAATALAVLFVVVWRSSQPSSTETTGDPLLDGGATDTTLGTFEPVVVDRGEYDPEDSLRIEIPLDAPGSAGGDATNGDGSGVAVDSSLEPLAMVIADGSVTLRGTAASQGQADAMIERAGEVFDTDEIVEEYEIDPAAPPAATGVVVQKPIVFESGSAEIRDEFKPVLDACADVLKSNPSLVMNVSGHTDDTGPTEINLALANDRAAAIVDYYVENGIETSTFQLIAVGDDKPIDSNDTDEGRQSNRRADLEFVGIFDDVITESGRSGN